MRDIISPHNKHSFSLSFRRGTSARREDMEDAVVAWLDGCKPHMDRENSLDDEEVLRYLTRPIAISPIALPLFREDA
jgi:hypothetical protein